MSYKDVSNVSALLVLNIFCDKNELFTSPSFAAESPNRYHPCGLKICFLLNLMRAFEPSSMYEML